MNGIIIIDKPLGRTSHDMVYVMRKMTGIKKVGHTGTLDPEATGVLPVCIGSATKVADMLTLSDKCYRADTAYVFCDKAKRQETLRTCKKRYRS